jgi:hypothetical protein
MKQNRIEEGRFTEQGHGLGTVTKEMVHKRAREIALINGREHMLDSDFLQAKRELTHEEHLTPEPGTMEKLPEDMRWEPVGESVGKEGPKIPAADEQTFAEKLVEEGVEDAEHDQMTRATRESLRRDHESEE